jgi:hypothetical protein
MADIEPFAGLTQEETGQGILLLLSAILDRLPRLDVNDRQIVSLAENTTGTVNVAGSLTTVTTVTTVGTVTTAADVTRVGNFGPNTTGLNMSASYFMQHAANAGSVHIYNQIAVS